ncbi:hypothetical protein K8942_03045 [Candidatus Peribacteria bacterium]|nr:MAG: hypothetical protein K8942_03045 [Candidatus Peribacteria bacterium]
MNRFFPALCSVVFFVSCTRAGDLPPSQVLHKAAEASQSLESAAFDVRASFSGKTELIDGSWDGDAHATGSLTDGGKQLQFALQVDATKLNEQKQKSTVSLSSDVIVAAENEVYLRLNTFTIDPASQLLPPELLAQMMNQWWVIPSDNADSPADLAPDPSLLRMQASVVTVTNDHGLTTIGDHTAYEYDITIDPQKMRDYLTEVSRVSGQEATADMDALSDLQANGTIWIDADTFQIHRISWTISSTNAAQPQDVELTVDISKHNIPVTFTLPTDAAPFPGAGLTTMSGSVSPSSR